MNPHSKEQLLLVRVQVRTHNGVQVRTHDGGRLQEGFSSHISLNGSTAGLQEFHAGMGRDARSPEFSMPKLSHGFCFETVSLAM